MTRNEIEGGRISAREMGRLAEIARVAAEQGLGHYLDRMGFAHAASVGDAPAKAGGRGARDAERLRIALERLGPTFVKFGQMLGTRVDVFPDEIVRELGALNSAVPSFPGDQARAIVEAELGESVASLFAQFDDEPFAAASIAQAHRARLHDGTAVVVKVQRPGIAEKIAADLVLMRHAARVIDRHIVAMKQYNVPGIVEEFAATIGAELDFQREAANADRFRESNRDEPSLWVPAIEWDLSSRRVLTMEESQGRTVDALVVEAAERRRLAGELMRLFLVDVFEHGVFHADPHSGNVFVLPDGRLCFHDFGQLGVLTLGQQDDLRQLLLALIARDPAWLADTYVAMGGGEGELSREAFVRDLGRSLDAYYAGGAGKGTFGTILGEFVALARKHRVRIAREIVLVSKAFMSIEAVTRTLDPDFDADDSFAAYGGRLIAAILRRDAEPLSIARGYRILAVMREAPGLAARLVDSAARGELKLQVRNEGRDAFANALTAAADRLGLGIVAASLVTGSVIVAATGTRYADALPPLGSLMLGAGMFAALLWIALVLGSMRARREHRNG